MPEVIPAILVKSFEELQTAVQKVEPFVERVHLDIIDGTFAANTTIKGYEELMRLKTNLKFDVHFMVSRPEDQMFEWYQTVADRFIFHVEIENHLQDLIDQVQLNGKRVALAINPETQYERADEYLEKLDHVQFMTVHPGLQGQAFLPDVLYKIQRFRQEHDMPIAVDGGINPQTAQDAVKSGASILVAGSAIMQSDDPAAMIEKLKKL